MAAPQTRRAFLLGLGAGAAAIGAAWGVARSGRGRAVTSHVAPPPLEGYVDYSGWMVTKADRDRLLADSRMRRLESSMFDGHDIADRIVGNVDECSAWCLSEADCQGYTFAKPTHPDPRLQNRCWLKGTSQLTPVSDPRFTSGVR